MSDQRPPPPPPGWYPPPPPPGWGQQPPPPPPGWGWGPQPPLPKAGSERTGPLPLHPMTVGDVLDGAFKLFKANARTLLFISGALFIPLELVVGFLQRHFIGGSPGLLNLNTTSSSTNAANVSVGTALTLLVGAFVMRYLILQLVTGAVSLVVSESYLGGQLGPGDALRATVRRWPALIVAYLLVHVAELFGFLACIVPGLLLMSLWFRAVPAIIVEGTGPIQGMRRSWRLGKSRIWPTIGIVLLAGIVSSVIGFAVALVPQIAGLAIGTSHGGWVLVAIGNVLNQMVAQPFVAIVATLLYFDARIRLEGFDLAILAQGLERGAAPA